MNFYIRKMNKENLSSPLFGSRPMGSLLEKGVSLEGKTRLIG